MLVHYKRFELEGSAFKIGLRGVLSHLVYGRHPLGRDLQLVHWLVQGGV